MISSSGEQNDKEVLETSFARLMQMCVIEVRGIAEVKISLPTPSLAHLSFSLRVYNCSVVGQEKCGIDNWRGGPLAKASQNDCS